GRLLVRAAAGRDGDGVARRSKAGVPVGCAGEPGRGAPRLRDAWLVQVLVAFDVRREAAFHEQPVADGRAPLDRVRQVHRGRPHDGRGVGIVARLHRGAARLPDLVGVDGDLVARAELPGDAAEQAVDRLVVDALLARGDAVDAVRVGLPGRHVER